MPAAVPKIIAGPALGTEIILPVPGTDGGICGTGIGEKDEKEDNGICPPCRDAVLRFGYGPGGVAYSGEQCIIYR